MNNIVVSSTAEVFTMNSTSSKVFFCGLTTKADVTQKIKQDEIRGAFGNAVLAVIQSEKTIEFDVTTALHNDDIYAIQSGTDFSKTTFTVQKVENLTMTVTGGTSGAITATGTPKAGTITVKDPTTGEAIGTTYSSTGSAVTVTGTGMTTQLVTLIYAEDKSDIDVLDLKQDAFPEGHYVQLHSIAYDKKKNTVVADIYWTFPQALPDGSINGQYEAGKNNGDTIKFKALADDLGSYGKYAIIPRA
jgi:hypothetical protein